MFTSEPSGPMSTKGAYVNAASQEDDGFVSITFAHAVILSGDMEPTLANTLLSIGSSNLCSYPSLPAKMLRAYAPTLLVVITRHRPIGLPKSRYHHGSRLSSLEAVSVKDSFVPDFRLLANPHGRCSVSTLLTSHTHPHLPTSRQVTASLSRDQRYPYTIGFASPGHIVLSVTSRH
ncbi:hypothetical protein F5Y05DRAFT_126970 [Hypoxylon sp. FL0543]|nr:hypothetical protein F5Y05DRAFT_126970 [Hypoxylon sp. FL0543]